LVFFDKACAQNEDEACHNAGVADYNQKGSNFFNYFTKGCNLNNPVSCDYLAKCHLQGNGTNPDPYTGFKVAEKASTLGACDPDDDMNLWLSSIHELGKRWSLLKSTRTNMRMAVKFAVRSCNCGFATGCFKAAYIYDKGEGNVERDVESASEYYEKACAKGFLEGCEQLYFFIERWDNAYSYKTLSVLRKLTNYNVLFLSVLLFVGCFIPMLYLYGKHLH